MKLSSLRACFSLLLLCACAHAAHAQGGQAEAVLAPAPDVAKAARAVGEARAPQGWQRYEIQLGVGSILSVVLPSPPQAFKQSIPLGEAAAAPATNYIFGTADGGGAYLISYIEGLPDSMTIDRDAQTEFFQGFWNSFAEGQRKRLRDQGLDDSLEAKPVRELRVGGYRAQAQDFTIGKRAGGARAVLAGGHAYMVVTLASDGKTGEAGKAFLDSFDVLPRR
ncbi:MAG: hypothetical protein ACJ741_03915 [Pyrinomonadaceae bacterium]